MLLILCEPPKDTLTQAASSMLLVFVLLHTCVAVVIQILFSCRVSLNDRERAFLGLLGPPKPKPWHDLAGTQNRKASGAEVRNPASHPFKREHNLTSALVTNISNAQAD